MNECRFEPGVVPLRCDNCNRNIPGTVGTCEDRDLCPACEQMMLAGTWTTKEIAVYRFHLAAGFDTKMFPTNRKLHFGLVNPLCATRGGPHPLTENIDEVNCKRCLRRYGDGH